MSTHHEPPSQSTPTYYDDPLATEASQQDLGRAPTGDVQNLEEHFGHRAPRRIPADNSQLTGAKAASNSRSKNGVKNLRSFQPAWHGYDDDGENDVPESLLVEPNEVNKENGADTALPMARPPSSGLNHYDRRAQARTHGRTTPPQRSNREAGLGVTQPRSLSRRVIPGGPKEKALWRWVNISNIDSFMRDVYDYYEGGGLICILCSNALWLLETLFVAVLLTFLSQCVDYSKVPSSRSLDQVIVDQCTRKFSGLWNFGIWLYSFFFIWKSVQYFFEIRRLFFVRDFFIHLLGIPEQDMQTVSWQDVVARIMTLRDHNPKTATNIPGNLRRFLGSQSKERLDAHDIANRLMRKENFLIAMINKDVLNLSLPFPMLRDKQLFSKTMEWYLHYCILDMAFNEFGQVRQDFLRADKRSQLSEKLRQRFYFAAILNLLFAPVVLAYVIIVYFFTYYNEYQKDPKLAAARKYTALAEWKFREFNELPHIFYERLHMSFTFATRYIDQFPKRMTEEIARTMSFMAGAITAVLAVCTILDSELFLGFEITRDRTVLFYLGVFGGIWAIARGMISEETTVFDPEYALRNVIEYTHYMPEHWNGRLHSSDVKREFSDLYKMKVVIFLEEVMGIITTPLLLLFSLPKCAEQVVDFFREFTIHVDGLGYVCSFAVFDFKKGVRHGGQHDNKNEIDIREDYYSTKHGKMAASYYGFLDNYVINPKTGIPGHKPPGAQQQFHPPPAFPSLNSPSLAIDVRASQFGKSDQTRSRMRTSGPAMERMGRGLQTAIPQPSPMASMLLDPHNQPAVPKGFRSLHRSRHIKGGYHGESQILEETFNQPIDELRRAEEGAYEDDDDGLEESTWELSPGRGLSRDNSAVSQVDSGAGVLGLIYQLQQTQHSRRGGVV